MTDRNAKLLNTLKKDYPDAKCELNFDTPFQLLVAVVLSAQCTDARVNLITPELFSKYKKVKKVILNKNKATNNHVNRFIY